MIFIDESGSITRCKDKKKRYFIISVVETKEPLKIRREFKKAKKNYINHHLSCDLDIKREIKGSQMPVRMKKYILERLMCKTDIKFHYIIIDNWNLYDNFHDNVELCFNYVLCNYLKHLCKQIKYDNLKLILDERNCKVASLNSLGDYLKIELLLHERTISSFTGCNYSDSQNYALLQIADLLANTVYRATLESNLSGGNCKLLINLAPKNNMYFPNKFNNLVFFKNNIFF